jgi:hypothetical protein
MGRRGNDPELWIAAFAHFDLAASAYTSATANTVEVDAESAGGFKNTRALPEAAAFAGWRKNDSKF